MTNLDTVPDGTYHADTGTPDVAKFGYYVGLDPNTRAGRNARLVGYWTAPNGDHFIDPSRWVYLQRDALELARKHNQIAIWDCRRNEEIYV